MRFCSGPAYLQSKMAFRASAVLVTTNGPCWLAVNQYHDSLGERGGGIRSPEQRAD